MPGNPKFCPSPQVKIIQRLETSTSLEQNVISSEGRQDTPACQISDHSCHAFYWGCMEILNLPHLSQGYTRLKNFNRPWPKFLHFWWSPYISILDFKSFLPCFLLRMPRNPKIWLVSQSWISIKMRKINIEQLAPLSFLTSIPHKLCQVRWGELHTSVITEHVCTSNSQEDITQANQRKPRMEEVLNLINTNPIQILNQHGFFLRFCMCPSSDTFNKK